MGMGMGMGRNLFHRNLPCHRLAESLITQHRNIADFAFVPKFGITNFFDMQCYRLAKCPFRVQDEDRRPVKSIGIHRWPRPSKNNWAAGLRPFRKAIGMNVSALARRLGISRNSVYTSIQDERDGTISLNHLDKMAVVMGDKLV